jgi:hypothetical protein
VIEARAELFRSLGALTEGPTSTHAILGDALGLRGGVTDADNTDLFGFQLYPYASVYLGEEGMLGGEARDRVAGFWRALQLTPPAEPDHLATLLALYASLMEAEEAEAEETRREAWGRSRKALLWEHLLSWLPPYLEKMKEIASPFYAGWADLLAVALQEEAAALGRPDALPLHLRMSALAPLPNDGKGLISWLLSPVQSGMILVRSDLQRAASDLNLGLRVDERRWVLQSLLGQDPEVALSWLAELPAHWADLHHRWLPVTGDVARYWIERTERAEALIGEALAESRLTVGRRLSLR